MKFGIHNPSWVLGPEPAEAFEAVKAKAQWAENHGFVWFSVMDHLIQIAGVGAPDEPSKKGSSGAPTPAIWIKWSITENHTKP